MKNIAIFASGSGSNAENLIRYFAQHPEIRCTLLLANKPEAYALERAKRLGIPICIFDRHDFYETSRVKEILEHYEIDYIVLAGFLWLMPENILREYPKRIVNIHPALLPAYGGKGMYGMNVHRAVVTAGESQSGITIHEVNNEYDRGTTLFQATCPVLPTDTPEMLAEKIHELEQTHFPAVVEKWILNQLAV